ncbi:MAG TPA: HAD-IIA family hydrolase [Bacillota bacterium]
MSINSIHAIIFDVDGVLFAGKQVIPGAPETVRFLKEAGKKLAVVSNNTSHTVEMFLRKFHGAGMPFAYEEIKVATRVTAEYIREKKPGARVYLVGSAEYAEELCKAGLQLMEKGAEADFLVVGNDRNISYDRYDQGLQALLHGAEFIAANRDPILPTEEGPKPGCGCLVAGFSAMCGRAPDVIIGKPSPQMLKSALKMLGVRAEEVLMVGDLLESDIVGAKGLGMQTALVLTGNGEASRKRITPQTTPDYIWPDLNSLRDLL